MIVASGEKLSSYGEPPDTDDIAECSGKEIGVEMGAALSPLDCVQRYGMELEKVAVREDRVTYAWQGLPGSRKA